LKENDFKFKESKGTGGFFEGITLELIEHDLKLIISLIVHLEDGYFIGTMIKVGPVTPMNRDNIVKEVQSLIDKEF
jgi:hypothetical protein